MAVMPVLTKHWTEMSISTYSCRHCLAIPSIAKQHSVAMATANVRKQLTTNVHKRLTGAMKYIIELNHLQEL